jgi:acyl carrier protein
MHAGVYRPLPHTDFSMSDAGRGFDYMARAKHLGKVVLTLGDPAALLAASRLYQAPPMGRTLGAILGESPTLAVAVTPAPAASPNGHQRPELATAYLAPGDEIERAVAGIWQELLGLERVGVLDNFFDLRGDSLLAAQVMARLHASQQVKLPLSALFDEPTVAGLSKRVRAARGVVRTMQASPVAARGADEEEGEI